MSIFFVNYIILVLEQSKVDMYLDDALHQSDTDNIGFKEISLCWAIAHGA